ncbi:MAG TPA: peptide deformylase [Acidimicrobiales bacterium]
MPTFTIRTYGDPVLRQRATEVTDVDGSIVSLAGGMVDAMYANAGLGVAAPQVGVQKRLFVYDLNDGEGAKTIVNPVITEAEGEWSHDEGCLSVPGLYFTILRPKDVLLTGFDLDGNPVRIEATDLQARLFQHELDHLDGTLLLEHLEPAQRKAGLRLLRERQTGDGRLVRGEPVTIDPEGAIVDD